MSGATISDEQRFEYFRDFSHRRAEAFKAISHLDWRTENSAKSWANRLRLSGHQGGAAS